ncbi:MAG: redoxin domain-containing protein [Verrucomicrobiaceae bacterium]|nr:redoxin domain-containing protein [Verrucomicrobiaceae bacterium]
MNLLARLAALSLSLSAPAFAAELVLTAIDGTQHTPLVAKDGKPVLLFFVSPFCSTTKAFVAEMNQITADHGSKMTVYIVQCDPEVTRDVAIEHATISGFQAPVLMDTAQELTKGVQATITPESVLLTPAGEVYYRGRINDLYLGPTKRQRAATTSDLRDAIASLLAGKPAPEAQEPAQGCKISGLK